MRPLAAIDEPATVIDELSEEIRYAVLNQPRSQQRLIGPSELGMPCSRKLLHKLNKSPPPAPAPNTYPVLPWLPVIGTAMHALLADAFSHSVNQGGQDGPRYLIEHAVNVGEVAGQEIWGNADLFDIPPGAVIDWKIVGPTTLKRVKAARHPGNQYRSQAHCYGRGFVRAGYAVNSVIIYFLPRNGEFAERYAWHEPYQESVALEALQRASGLADLIAAIGIDAAVALYPPCTDSYCIWCGQTYVPRSYFDLKG
jgi:hypothetical protein